MDLSPDQLLQFRNLYSKKTNAEVAEQFDMTVEQVGEIADALGLGKDKRFFPGMPMPRWSDEEKTWLRENYANKSNVDLSAHLRRSVKSVVSQAHRMRLKKDAAQLTQTGRENVAFRRDRMQKQ